MANPNTQMATVFRPVNLEYDRFGRELSQAIGGRPLVRGYEVDPSMVGLGAFGQQGGALGGLGGLLPDPERDLRLFLMLANAFGGVENLMGLFRGGFDSAGPFQPGGGAGTGRSK